MEKNIHLIPTDNPSKLRYFDSKLEILSLIPKKSDIVFQNIYITSDEEIKLGDYYIDFTTKGLMVESCKTKDDGILVGICGSKKIILTTDPKLINDGIQEIDDEFLEWFVKNPNTTNIRVTLHVGSLRCNHSKNTYTIDIPEPEELKDKRLSKDTKRKEIINYFSEKGYGKFNGRSIPIVEYICFSKWLWETHKIWTSSEMDYSYSSTKIYYYGKIKYFEGDLLVERTTESEKSPEDVYYSIFVYIIDNNLI
jgi:hypothetical protein